MIRPLRSNLWLASVSHRTLRSLSSSAAATTEISTSASNAIDSLRLRVSQIGDPKASILPVLGQWLYEGKGVQIPELQSIIKMLRHHRRFEQALEISEWMTWKMDRFISFEDIAIQLDLISNIHGREEAENYFNSIPEIVRPGKLYNALLNIYAQNKCLEKAEVTMQKMRELGFITSALPFNIMLGLYAQLGRLKEIDILMQEMEETRINGDSNTFATLLRVYGMNSHVEGIEKVLTKMVADPHSKVDWNAFIIAAYGCLKAGLTEQTMQLLKKAEQLLGKKPEKSYEKFLSLYAACGRKDEVYRLWNLYKKTGKFNHSGYMSMISSLVKFDDFDGAEKIFDEWESGYSVYDPQVPNVLISAYSKRGLLEKAEFHVNRLINGGKEPSATMWSALASGYQRNEQMEKSVEASKKAILASTPQWKPNYLILAACVEYLEGKGDKIEADVLLKLLKERGYVKMADNIKIKDLRENDNNQVGGDENYDGQNPVLCGLQL